MSSRESKFVNKECIKGNCAWYVKDTEHNECAIKSIAMEMIKQNAPINVEAKEEQPDDGDC